MAGSANDEELARYVRDEWTRFGLDSVELNSYEMMFSYPDKEKPNKIRITEGNGDDVFVSTHREELDGGEELSDDFVDGFLAYSPKAFWEGRDIVYVNYGSNEDLNLLTSPGGPYKTDLNGKICMARWGGTGRTSKVQNMQGRGCVAAIIFSDPNEVAYEGTSPADVYPNTKWQPGTGMQRGWLKLRKGDPETPGWPSVPDAYRVDGDDLEASFLQIPAQPIGYDDAKKIFQRLEGKDPPPSWIGMIEGVSYTIGGAFKDTCGDNCTASISVNNVRPRTVSSNVVGILKGSVEPDRYVIMGNHRDAWTYGAVDAIGGTSALMEVARILGEKATNEGWRPRRTMVFISWAGEEYGNIASQEFNEDFKSKLSERTVAYLNLDVCTLGPTLIAKTTPSLTHKIFEATKQIPYPMNPQESYYDYWKRWTNSDNEDPDVQLEPTTVFPTRAGDAVAFLMNNGIPTLDFVFRPDNKADPKVSSGYPNYHTAFDTFKLVDEIFDYANPKYGMHEACSKMLLYLGRDLADSIVIEYDMEVYATVMQAGVQGLRDNGAIAVMQQNDIDTGPWENMVATFAGAAYAWRQRFDLDRAMEEPLLARIVNDQMMELERAFLLPLGLPQGRDDVFHAILTPSVYSKYRVGVFPGITDLLIDIDTASNPTELAAAVKEIKMHLSQLLILLKSAADFLNEVDEIV